MNPIVNKWLDLLDRAGWTAVQSAAGAALAWIAIGDLDWDSFVVVVGAATGIAVLKVLVGQKVGPDETGSLIGKPVVEPPPK